MNRLRVLFVDDEPRVLDGLKRMLRDMRNEWDMEFRGNPEDAIIAITHQPFDVVVSDMQMPRMNGAQLLTEVRQLCPSSVRIILSGHSNVEAAIEAAAPTHQFLAKPCDPDQLRAVVQRAALLGSPLRRDALLALVNRIASLPKRPGLFDRLTAELRSPEITGSQIAAIVAADPGLCAEVLKLANSAFFRVSGPVTAIERAIQIIGIDNVAKLVTAAALKPELPNPEVPASVYEGVWEHSLLAARCAGLIAGSLQVPRDVAEAAITGALLHDVGELVLLSYRWNDYSRLVDGRGATRERRSVLERRVLGVTHADVGAYLLGLWNLPGPVVEAVGFHSDPIDSPARELGPLALVHLADVIAREQGGLDPADRSADHQFLARVGIEPRWDEWRALCAPSAEEGAA